MAPDGIARASNGAAIKMATATKSAPSTRQIMRETVEDVDAMIDGANDTATLLGATNDSTTLVAGEDDGRRRMSEGQRRLAKQRDLHKHRQLSIISTLPDWVRCKEGYFSCTSWGARTRGCTDKCKDRTGRIRGGKNLQIDARNTRIPNSAGRGNCFMMKGMSRGSIRWQWEQTTCANKIKSFEGRNRRYENRLSEISASTNDFEWTPATNIVNTKTRYQAAGQNYKYSNTRYPNNWNHLRIGNARIKNIGNGWWPKGHFGLCWFTLLSHRENYCWSPSEWKYWDTVSGGIGHITAATLLRSEYMSQLGLSYATGRAGAKRFFDTAFRVSPAWVGWVGVLALCVRLCPISVWSKHPVGALASNVCVITSTPTLF